MSDLGKQTTPSILILSYGEVRKKDTRIQDSRSIPIPTGGVLTIR